MVKRAMNTINLTYLNCASRGCSGKGAGSAIDFSGGNGLHHLLSRPMRYLRAGSETRLGRARTQWLREAETYAFDADEGGYVHRTAADWDALAQSKVTFITHCPISRSFFARCHALGIRCVPYVTFSNAWTSMTYQDVNLKDHPEFSAIDGQGNFQRMPLWDSEDSKNRYNICPNVAEFQDAMVVWVEKIMKLGADGVFVDNVENRFPPCDGPKFGKHKHMYKDQTHAYAMLLKRVREVVKRYQPDGAILINSGTPTKIPVEYWKYVDADMLESYICSWASKERWLGWENWHEQGVQLRPYIRAGKQVQALSYLGSTPYGVKEDAFFCYATARLAGLVWNAGLPMSRPETAPLYRLRLGRPLQKEVKEDSIYWRAFEAGLVAVNPDRNKAGFITVKPPIPTTRFCNVFDADTAREIVDVAKTKKLPRARLLWPGFPVRMVGD